MILQDKKQKMQKFNESCFSLKTDENQKNSVYYPKKSYSGYLAKKTQLSIRKTYKPQANKTNTTHLKSLCQKNKNKRYRYNSKFFTQKSFHGITLQKSLMQVEGHSCSYQKRILSAKQNKIEKQYHKNNTNILFDNFLIKTKIFDNKNRLVQKGNKQKVIYI